MAAPSVLPTEFYQNIKITQKMGIYLKYWPLSWVAYKIFIIPTKYIRMWAGAVLLIETALASKLLVLQFK